MEVVTVEVFIPATGALFDFKLPSSGIVSDMAQQMADALESVEHNITFDRKCLMLCDLVSKRALPLEAAIAQCGVMDGRRLMLL